MKKLISSFAVLLLPVFIYGQVIDNFEAEPDTSHWDYDISANADPALSYVNESYVTDPVNEGSMALQLDYSAHNIESWGGYAKVYHLHPDVATGGTYDWTGYDSISVSYYNSSPQSEAGAVHLRLNLSDYAGITDDAYVGLGEYYYSFLYILDNEPGWNTVTMPLVRNDSWDGGGFNLTGWAGDSDDGELDLHAIGGFHFEFSIGGAGEGNSSSGTIVLDNFTLTGYQGTDLVIFNGMSTPPAWGNPFSWGGAQMYVTEGGGYDEGTNALTYVQQDVWSGGGFNMAPAVDFSSGGEWSSDSLSFHMWSEADAPTLRLQFEDGTDKVGLNFTPEAAEGWNHYSFPLSDFVYFDGSTAFDTSAVTVFQVLSEGNGAAGRTFHFDNVWTGNPDFDVIAPDAPENVGAVPADYYNLVTWSDVSGESDELYHVYASADPITDVDAGGAELVAANVLEGSQAAVHYLYAPLNDASVSYYYAVVCVDAAGNRSELGASTSSITNTAQGIPTISLDVPENFVADGDMSEWEGVMPFVINPTTGHVAAGTVDGDDDLTGTVYLAIDDDYLYFAADVIDDSYSFGDGDWWNQDALQFFIGLYDWRGPKHSTISRGDEPDYILYANESTLQLDISNGGSLAAPGSDDFYFEGFNPDYATEGRISLDTLAAANNDERFHPVNGMRIPLDIYFHDQDNGSWEGNIGFSHLSTDQQWNNPGEWAFTWIGDASVVSGVDDEHSLVADEFVLYPNYPNPFNPETNIRFSLPEDQIVTLNIYNMTGQLVESLVNERRSAGVHSVHWNASGVASGVYLYQLQVGGRFLTQKMILMK
ncbi:MAG: T9SS type A sorting domain-containing protein [Candidatus Marinimicrobia bacterium]|nr:T9SS type A sorting domain-containing protein [Candidatus Neomarinimicrobiota bacterium]